MSVRDHLYQEGIALGDFVVNELIQSQDLRVILKKNDLLIEMFETKLKAEISRFRKNSINMMQRAQLIDVTPNRHDEHIVASQASSSIRTLPRVYGVASPAAVSQPVIEMLKSMHLFEPSRSYMNVRKISIQKNEIGEETIAMTPIESSEGEEGDGFSDNQSSTLNSLFPTSIGEIKIHGSSIYESKDPFRLFGVLECALVDTPRRKRRRDIADGYFDKEGNYHAAVYGGYVHLCSGALEWPFKSADVQFRDFHSK